MATYSAENFNTKHYDLARPSYPDQFYQTLIDYHLAKRGNRLELALDIGTGSGFVALKLINFFQKVIGTDLSPTMIKSCSENPISMENRDKISFHVSKAEKSPDFVKENSIDMITGAECCHWLDHSAWFKECHRILKPGGTLSYWFYLDPVFIGNDFANDLFTRYAYGSSFDYGVLKKGDIERYMGPYYEQPGHEFLRTALKTVEIPPGLFEDQVVRHYDPKVHGVDPNFTTLFIEKHITLSEWKNYVKSWSAYHAWMKDHGQSHKDIAEVYVDELKQNLNWNDETVIHIVFPTIYYFARKI
ncbi:S-adenosyl-L-methionine-dependent methyltransferase [Hyphopichia burtonii NRRL Y-1933]|uniref:S-adenosyl-L-methionine-dependent methyltransferase n=1 Tax=Hyphopichia burtonii NRRL Y-1933 TaxID=984485 RepID=A0A1E4RD24_9ASCO|nr:S-adenosyl-L-methionine-dependent methyltransferase [Hyphopichia burtonii NRRL Y-1933]ODV65035.1 S-adenosyl-L-methionine-dependent methyltransferase [Hyphopichia burtonii NRRL Y-1933]